MKVFVTGATGFVGSAIVPELIQAGHQVVGLARSDANADWLKSAGAEVHRGNLEDLDSLKSGAADADGVIHAGFIHDWSRFAEVAAIDRAAIEACGEVLLGSDRPLVVTSGTALVNPGGLATEDIMPPFNPNFPRASEVVAQELASKGVKAMAIRLSPTVHGDGDHGFVPILIGLAKEKGFSAYVGDGSNRWSAVHRLDSAVLYRLALEKGTAGAHYHGVAEEGVPFKEIAERIGRGLNVPVKSISPEEAEGHFGWFSRFAALDIPASSQWTRETLGWSPSHVSLLDDLAKGKYFSI